MARTLDALKRAHPASTPGPVGPHAPRPTRPEPTADGDEAEPMPFIEVGGRGAPVDGSPDVLGSGKPAPVEAPARHQESREPAVAFVAAPSAPANPVQVVFRPLSAEPLPLAPAPERFAPELVAFHRPKDPASEQYRNLLAALDAQLPAGRSQVLLFSGSSPGAGATTVLLNLAITAAKGGKTRVAVVDANLRYPALAERLGLRSVPGLGEVLVGTVPLEHVLQQTGQPNLYAVTAGRARGAAYRLSGEAVRGLLARLRDGFDRVFVDAAPWDGRPETVALGAACDGVYLVAPQADERSPEVAELLRTIPQQGGRLHGCVLTRW